jgi:hypothetical protein
MKGTSFLVLTILLFQLPAYSQHYVPPERSATPDSRIQVGNPRTQQTTRVYWHRNKVDMGYIERNETRTEVVICTNTGDAPLRIQAVKFRCEGLQVTFPESDILPGQQGKITVTLTPSTKGELPCYLTVISNSRSYADIICLSGIRY